MAETATLGTSVAALTFTFSTQSLRAVLIDGEPWFCASDACDALGYTNARKAIADHCRAGGVTKRDTPTSSGVQPLTYINEGNLYRLCIKSHKPEAQKFEAWVCDEVLPAIRRTGRYVAPSAEPVRTAESEHITANDITHIKRVIWMVVSHFRFSSAWNQGVWYHLRNLLGLPSPAPLCVEHLPIVARELSRMMVVSEQVNAIVRDIESDALRRILRRGESADLVLADIRRQAQARMERIDAEATKLPDWLRQDIAAITARTRAASIQYLADEQPGYFDHVSKVSTV